MLPIFMLLCVSSGVLAQSRTVSGVVTDAAKEPLPGVSVIVKGTTNGSSTDVEGRFSLQVTEANPVLVVNYIGYESQEVTVQGNSPVTIVLQTSAKALEEVVVVGYGTQKKVNLTGSVSVVDGGELTKRPVASTGLALQGIAPGVNVQQQSGLPGGDSPTIRIRGLGSIAAGSNPLVLVDNVEMSLDAIDPNNIESISILKDAAAAAVYGSKAANGVVLITTKRGSAKGINVQYNMYAGWQKATNMPDKVNALDHMKYFDIAQVNDGNRPSFTDAIARYEATGPDNFSLFNTDWVDEVLSNNGAMQSHNLILTGGTDKIKTFASGSYLNQNGLTQNTNYQRIDFRFNTDMELAKGLTASMDLVMNRGDRTWPGDSSPGFLIRQAIGLPAYVPGRFNTGEYGAGWENRNPIAQAEASGFNDKITNSRIISGTLRYTPIEGLELFATYSINRANERSTNLIKQYQVYEPDLVNNVLKLKTLYPPNTSISDMSTDIGQDLFRTQATYNKSFGKHNLTLLGGFSTEDNIYSFINGSRANLLTPDLPFLSSGDPATQIALSGARRQTMVSLYSRVAYNYDEKYLLELNGRWDASSRFQDGNRWGMFPSISAGWRISQEDFWEGISGVVNEAKIRASYGALGNQNLGSSTFGFYPTYPSYAAGNAYNYFFNNSVSPGYVLLDTPNRGILWETSKIFDIGADFGLLNNQLSITADYFSRDIEDMLQRIPIPNYVGAAAPYVNAGTMRNTGWELGVTWKDDINDFHYQIQANLSDVKNEVTNLNGQEYVTGNLIGREGYAYNSYYGYIAEGLFQSQDEVNASPRIAGNKPGDVKYRDVSGPNGIPDGLIDTYDRVVLGNSMPRYEYSANFAAQYKGFDATIFFQGIGKRDNYMSGTGVQPFYSGGFQGTMYEFQKDFWTPENPGAAYPQLSIKNVSDNPNYRPSSYWIKSGAYLRLKNVVLGYTLPKELTQKVKISSWRFYASAQNLFTWDNFYPGFDPEINDNTGDFYPIMKTFTFGMNIKF
ncbi:SusC/RagA family TonB-linked outer membrane protein [Rufibacter immobilis]|nr:TonB-dependent receptor [Rufibacter immobilis]